MIAESKGDKLVQVCVRVFKVYKDIEAQTTQGKHYGVTIMRKLPVDQKGFTLIELMIVVAIIGILMAVAIPAYINHVYRVREGNCVQDILDMKAAQEKYYALNDAYATSIADAEYSRFLNFDTTNPYCSYSFASASTNSFTIQIDMDLNQDGSASRIWQVSDNNAAPQNTVEGDEGFKLSIVGNLFD